MGRVRRRGAGRAARDARRGAARLGGRGVRPRNRDRPGPAHGRLPDRRTLPPHAGARRVRRGSRHPLGDRGAAAGGHGAGRDDHGVLVRAPSRRSTRRSSRAWPTRPRCRSPTPA
jgi:hypothetical protein